MATTSVLSTIIFFLFLLFATLSNAKKWSDYGKQNHQQTVIVHVSRSHKPHAFASHHHWYSSILGSLSPVSRRPSEILYTYDHAVNGFSARLTASQAEALRQLPGILSVVPDRVRHVHTTHTPHFLGLDDSSGIWPNSSYGEDVIVGVLDTGIWPERSSFSDDGLSPVPFSWKGLCETGPEFPAASCNRKIIGARAFYKGYEADFGKPMDESLESKSPRDTQGHGTHTASTAAGSIVANASFYEYARGEARGMASKARIAVYKVCWTGGCYDSDLLAAMEQAVIDGVHVISLSVGADDYAPSYDGDSIAIGAFGAAQHGVLVSCSAGNSGPGRETATNIAPWILTVAASTIDREFPADAVLGDGRVFGGVSLYSGDPLVETKLPLVYAEDCGSKYCFSGELNSSKVAGKIVICDRGGNARAAKGSAVKLAGGAGMIMANTEDSGEELIADAHLIPATIIGQKDAEEIKYYARHDPSPTATIVFRGTVIGSSPPAPRVAAFSSRGPNHQTPEILKPDITAPGVNILAAWTGSSGPTDLDIDPRRVEFNIISGTSMSCPHVSGLAALLRKTYPKWTTSAIKSALMTTAYNLDNSGNRFTDLSTGEEATPFAYGSGHVNPDSAIDPGLVYDITPCDYVTFLSTIGYDAKTIALFVGGHTDCPTVQWDSPGDLNYPSFSVAFKSRNEIVKYQRAITNVGSSLDAVYEVKLNAPPSVDVTVSPSKLVFTAENKTLSYEITFTSVGLEMVVGGGDNSDLTSAFGSIEWSDGVHRVRSPIAVLWSLNEAESS